MENSGNTLNLEEVTVAEVALAFPQACDILTRYNLDFCCGGGRSFVEVCGEAGVEPRSVWQEITGTSVPALLQRRIQFETWSEMLLMDYIIQHHHHYVRKQIPRIRELLSKVSLVHGYDCPYLTTVEDQFNLLGQELLEHMPKEEEILFPAARNLLRNTGAPLPFNTLVNLDAPIRGMEHEHAAAGTLIKSIRSLTSHYAAPDFACTSFRQLYHELRDFDDDLMQHIHLENNILFPKLARAMG